MPVILFEYMSFGLPVIVTNCIEMAAFVAKTGIGLVADDNPESLAGQIYQILSDSVCYQKAAKSVRAAVENGHLWTDRARVITHALTNQ
jgi:glycosyltransferase involved in cell wall biosynthesis